MTRTIRGLMTVSAVALLCAAGGLAFANAMPPDHRATAWLQVGPALTGSTTVEAVTAAEMLAREHAELLTAPSVLTPAMVRLGWTDAETFRQRIDVAWVPDTSIVTVAFTDADPDRARRAADAVAESFVERSRQFQTADRVGAARELDIQVATLEEEVRVLNLDIERQRARIGPPLPPGGSPSAARAIAEADVRSLEFSRQLKQQTLGLLHLTSSDLGLDWTGSGVRIADAARIREGREMPQAFRYAGLAALPGTLVAVGALVLLRLRVRRPRRYIEAAAALRVEVLGALRPLGTQGGPGLLWPGWQSSSGADDIRALRLNLLSVGESIGSLLVTSPFPRDGRSLLAANLALASDEAGTATVLIDADLQQPSQHRNFNVDPSFGLVDLLADPASIRDSLWRFRIADSFFVIPVGRGSLAKRETLTPAALHALLREVVALTHGFVIVDGGSVLSQSETLALARGVDGVLVLADPTFSSPSDTQHAVRLLQRLGANVLGLVLARFDRTKLVPVQRPARADTAVAGPFRARPTVASWLLLVWAALLGVQLQQEFIPHFYIAVSDFILIPLSTIVILDPQLRRRALAMPTTLVWFFVALACAVALGSIVDALTLGFVPREGWLNKGLGVAVLAASIACVRAIATTRESVHGVLRALLIGAIGSAGIAILPYLDVGPLADLLPDRGVRFTGLLQDANAAGLYYTVALLLMFAFIAGAPLGLGKWTRIGGALLLGIANVLTFSLSSFAAGLASFSVLVAGLPGRRWPAALALLLVLVLTIPFLSAAVAPATVEGDIFERAAAARSAGAESALWTEQVVGSRAAGAVAIKGASVFDRLAVLTLAFDLWTSDVWTVLFGIGLGAFPVHSTMSPLATVVIIHNTYLWLVIELGIVGLVALLLLLWYIAQVSIGLLRFSDRTVAVALIASLVTFLVWWQFNEGLYQRSFWLLLGAAGVLAELAPAKRSHNPARTHAAFAPGGLRA